MTFKKERKKYNYLFAEYVMLHVESPQDFANKRKKKTC